MAARIFEPSLLTFGSTLYVDLTAETGGNSADVGYTGADFMWTRVGSGWPGGVEKEQGGEQILNATFKTGADPALTISSGNYSTHQPYVAALDQLDTVNAQAANGGCVGLTTASNQIGCGIDIGPITCDQKLRTFIWIGRIKHGTYTVTATLANGETAPVTITLPLGSTANTTVEAWWKWQFRSLAATTVTFRLERTAVGPSAVGVITNQVGILTVPVNPPKPHGRRIRGRH